MTPQFKPMLAKDGDLTKLKFPVAVQSKLDGIRASVVNGKLVSRTLKPIPNAEIRAALERPEFEGLDGELIVGSAVATDCYRTTVSFVMAPNKTGEPWTFHAFDKWDHPGHFQARYDAVFETLTGTHHGGRIKVVSTAMADSIEAVNALEELTVAQGGEGIIVRTLDSPYKFGRSGKTGPLLKVKRFEDFEAVVIGVYEEMHNANERYENELGRGQRSTAQAGLVGKDRLGGLILRGLNSGWEGVEFRCGTGFDHEQREVLWKHRESIVEGEHVAKVKCFPVGVKDKPRHPVFLGWRDVEAGA